MVYVYAADIRNLKDPKKYPELLQNLTSKDKTEILDSRYINKRIGYLGLALLLKEVFSRHKISDSVCLADIYKNPILDKFYISFSSSKNLIICAVSEHEIGCDIEKIREAPQNLPTIYFSKLERDYLKSFQSQYIDEEYYRLYTLKESYIKMTGEQIARPAKTFEVVIGEDIEIYRNDQTEICWIEEYYIPGYQLSVCSKDSQFASEITFINLL